MKQHTRAPETPATRQLKAAGADFRPHTYDYEARGGTRVSAASLGVDEHSVVKTLVFENEAGQPLIVLMHGDRTVSLKELARQIGHKKIEPCTPDAARRHTGYLVGGTSPFGTKKDLPVYVESSILELPLIYINGGQRGFLVSLSPSTLVELLSPTAVQVALEK